MKNLQCLPESWGLSEPECILDDSMERRLLFLWCKIVDYSLSITSHFLRRIKVAEAVLGFVSSLASASFLRMGRPVQPESDRDSVLFSEPHSGAVLGQRALSPGLTYRDQKVFRMTPLPRMLAPY